MFCLASCLRRSGHELNRFQATAVTTLGQLSLGERFDERARRCLQVARLLPCGGRDEDLLPPLLDAVVLYAAGKTWTIRGTEREVTAAGVVSFEQTWILRELTGRQVERVEAELRCGREPRFAPAED